MAVCATAYRRRSTARPHDPLHPRQDVITGAVTEATVCSSAPRLPSLRSALRGLDADEHTPLHPTASANQHPHPSDNF